MQKLKPKEQHERLLAAADKEQIVQHLNQGREQDIIQAGEQLGPSAISRRE